MADGLRPIRDRLEEIGALSLGDDPPHDSVEAVLRRWTTTLNGADDLREQVERDALVELTPIKAGQVDAALRSVSGDGARGELQGSAVEFEDPEPWPDPVDGAELLEDLRDTFNRFLALPDGAATTQACWIVHAHAHDASDISPVLALTSPTKRCGKTTDLEVLGALAPRPLPAANITAASLFRAVEKFSPTLLIDEADTFLRRGDDLRGVLNSGHSRRSAFIVRTVGDDHEPRRFRTWAPKAIALIGELPDTLADRSIEIRMRRRRPDEEVERLRLDRLEEELEPLRRRAWTWARDHLEALGDAEPAMPEYLHDRERDNWRPLLSIADLAGGPWPERARKAARALQEGERDERSLGTRLLADVRSILEEHPEDRIRSKHLVEKLCDLEEAPWSEYKSRGLSPVSLANFLRSFDVSSKQLRFSTGSYKGYEVEAFEDAFHRYLPSQGGSPNPEHPKQSRSDKGSDGLSGRNEGGDVSSAESAERPKSTDHVSGVTPSQEGATEGDTELPEDVPEIPF